MHDPPPHTHTHTFILQRHASWSLASDQFYRVRSDVVSHFSLKCLKSKSNQQKLVELKELKGVSAVCIINLFDRDYLEELLQRVMFLPSGCLLLFTGPTYCAGCLSVFQEGVRTWALAAHYNSIYVNFSTTFHSVFCPFPKSNLHSYGFRNKLISDWQNYAMRMGVSGLIERAIRADQWADERRTLSFTVCDSPRHISLWFTSSLI